MLDAGGGAECSTITRVKCNWQKLRDLLPLLGSKAVYMKVEDCLYKSCDQTVLLYGSETWPGKTEDTQRLDMTEMSMIGWMCGSLLTRQL
jgi:hypothetical protein